MTLLRLHAPDGHFSLRLGCPRRPSSVSGCFCASASLSFRVLDDQEAVIDACCDAWNALAAETGRLQSLSSYPWITKVSS